MDAHEKKNSSFDDREVDSHHQLAPVPDWKRDSFNQRLYWLQEATSFSDDSETTLKPSLKCAVNSPGAFWPWPRDDVMSFSMPSLSLRLGNIVLWGSHAAWILVSWSTKPQCFTILCRVIQYHLSPPNSSCWPNALKQMWAFCIKCIGQKDRVKLFVFSP